MISLDKALLGADYSGDVLERHQEYGQRAGHLDIIVFSKKGFQKKEVSPHLTIYPTNSFSKFCYLRDAGKIVKDILRSNQDIAPSDNTFELRENPQRGFSLLGNTRSAAPPAGGDGHHARSHFQAAQRHYSKAQWLIVSQDPFLTGLAGWRIKKRFGLPLLLHFHGDFWDNRYWLGEKWFNPIFLLISRFLVKRADGVRVVSAGIREKLIRKRINRSKIRVIPTPVEIAEFEKYNPERVRTIKEKRLQGRKLVINVGNNSPAKDYPTLLEAIDFIHQDYPNLAFWQIGADLDLGEKRMMAVSSRKISRDVLADYYQAADVYLSSSRHESFGKVLVEAMAAGLPIVATATTGSKEIVADNESGFLVPVGDSQGLAEKVIYLLNHPERARAMGEKGREMIKDRFNKKEIVDKIINFWQDLIDSNY